LLELINKYEKEIKIKTKAIKKQSEVIEELEKRFSTLTIEYKSFQAENFVL